MTQPQNWDIGGDAGNSFKFDNVGDSVTGTIKSLIEVQSTDMKTGEPDFWPGGQPKMMYRCGLATALRDPSNPMDDGHRDVYLKGSRKSESQSSLAAVLDAVKRATGGTNMEPGATVTLTYVGEEPIKNQSPRKLYTANYLRPPMNLGGQQQTAPAPAQQYQPPVQQPQYQQPAAPAYAPPAAPVQQQVYQPPAQPAYTPPPAPAAQAPAAPVAWPWTDAQLAAVRASGVDPASVWPGAWQAHLTAGGQ